MSTSTLAHELKTRNVPRMTDGSGGVVVTATVNTLPCGIPVPCCVPTRGADDPAREVDAPELGDASNAGGL